VFGMGWAEIFLIGIVGVLVFGPDKLPDFARQAARMVRTVRRMAQDAKNDLGRELGQDLSGIGLRDLNPREVVRRTILEASEDEPQSEPEPRGEHRSSIPPIDPDAT
jgi:sec-independent protein translocase protein TatB